MSLHVLMNGYDFGRFFRFHRKKIKQNEHDAAEKLMYNTVRRNALSMLPHPVVQGFEAAVLNISTVVGSFFNR